MSALSESLVAAQRQAIAALSKQYLADHDPNPEMLAGALTDIGCTDKVEQGLLIAALDVLHVLGAQAPEAKPDTSNEPASDAQMKYLRDLADRNGTTAPDYVLTKTNASKVIEQLKAGTYNPDEWTVPF